LTLPYQPGSMFIVFWVFHVFFHVFHQTLHVF
jgi:hypothetical protein